MIESYVRQFEAAAANGGAKAPDWLKGIRQGAIDGFRQSGFPSTKDEEWRFTSVAPIARGGFVVPAKPGALSLADLAPFLFDHAEWPRLVFVDGRFVGAGAHGIMTSSDALVWTSELDDASFAAFDLTWTGTMLIAVGQRGAIFTALPAKPAEPRP